MTLLSAWALAGLLLTIPLVLVHMRRSRPPVRDVSSLLPWRALASNVPSSTKRLGRPLLPFLLALQLLALALLVLSLARPASGLEASGQGRVFVLDTSFWMQQREGGVERIALERRQLSEELRQLGADTHVQIVLAGAAPSLLYSGSSEGAANAIGKLHASDGEADIATALRLAAGRRRSDGEQIVLLRAPEDEAPHVLAQSGAYQEHVIGQTFSYQALRGANARCGLPSEPPCQAFARVVNTTDATQTDRVSAQVPGYAPLSEPVTVAPHSSAAVAFHAPPDQAVTLRLDGEDTFPPEREAFVAVPGGHVTATLVGDPAHAEPLARALEADPEIGESLHLTTLANYRPQDAETSQLLVIDGPLPPGGLPRTAASVLLVAPPSLPSPGEVFRGFLRDNALSGSNPASPLLAGVDLESLTIDAKGAEHVSLPSWMQAEAWSSEGALLAAGSLEGQRIGLLTFEPFRSNLPQLAGFPRLISNLVSWSQEFVPTEIGAGEEVLIPQTPGLSATTLSAAGSSQSDQVTPGARRLSKPDLYTVTEHGSWGERQQTIAVNASTGLAHRATTVDLSGPGAGGSSERTAWWPWVLVAALIVLMLEFFYGSRRRVRSALA